MIFLVTPLVWIGSLLQLLFYFAFRLTELTSWNWESGLYFFCIFRVERAVPRRWWCICFVVVPPAPPEAVGFEVCELVEVAPPTSYLTWLELLLLFFEA